MERTIRQPRFMREYAQNKCKQIANEGINGRCTNAFERIARITTMQTAYSHGIITLDEAMREIAEA